MKHTFKYYLAIALLLSLRGFSQEVPKGAELAEFIKISEAYRQLPDLSFNMAFTYADSAQPNTILEQLQGSYKIHNGKYWGMLDSIEYLQGSVYNLAIYHRDSIITVNDRQEYAGVLQIPMMDSLFREANVTSMQVTRLNDSTRSLVALFSPQSQYRRYEIQYDLKTFLIRKVKYYLPDPEHSDTPGSSGVICVSINFSNYSAQLISEDYFNESKFIYRQTDQVVPAPSFAGFRVVMTGK